jgi:hypothetical protein
MLELFALQMEQFNSDTSDKEKWSLADRERLKAVHDFITQSYVEPLTLSCLCYKFGLNEFKLKKGYQGRRINFTPGLPYRLYTFWVGKIFL